MPTQLRSYSKINLGLAIGPVRADGFHGLTTLYQTLELHDRVTVEARLARSTSLRLTCNHVGVPADARNTAWRMIEKALALLKTNADVQIHIDKRLPVQGGLGAGSANAVAALFGLERELGLELPGPARLELAAEIGSDVPLFAIGGAVLGLGRGEEVYPMPDLPSYHCVLATPEINVATPQAFRDWDAQAARAAKAAATVNLTPGRPSATLKELSRSLAASLGSPHSSGVSPQRGDLAENPLLALVRTGIENDFEQVVFPQYPLLGDIKRILAIPDPEIPEQSALYAALSGSGSAVFGLYATTEAAKAAHRRLRELGITAHLTRTLPRAEYWQDMLLA